MPAPIAPRPPKPTRRVSPTVPLSHLAGGLLHRLDDPQISRAAAEVAGERLPQLVVARVWMLPQEGLHGHQEARRAEPALERMRLVERTLERVEGAVGGQPFDRPEAAAVRLHREREAGAHRDAVELDGAGAADALLAADLRPGQPGTVPDEVRQERP